MTKNMIEGNPAKLILSFAVPLLMGNLLQQTYNMIDAAIVGNYLGASALASVGASSSVQFLVLGFCTGVCAGFGVPIAKNFGAGREEAVKRTVFNAYLLTIAIATIITGVTTIFCHNIMQLMKTPSDIYDDAYAYLFVIFCGIPFTMAYNLFAAMLRSVGDSRTPFVFLAISTVLNILLDLLLIIVFGMGCMGAGLATILAQAISAIACFIFIQCKMGILKPSGKTARFNKRSMWELIYMGVPMGLQFSITAIGSMVMQSSNNGLDNSTYVSAFAAASKLKQFSMCPFDAIATGVSVFVSQNLGAGKASRIKKGIKTGVLISAAYGLAIGMVLVLFGKMLSYLFIDSSEAEVLDASAKYLLCIGFFFWSLGPLGVCRLTIQGLGYSAVAIFSGIIEMIARITVSSIFVPKVGFTAICFTDQSAWLSATIYCAIVCYIVVKKVEKKITNIS